MSLATEDRVVTPFDQQSTAADVLSGVDLTGKRVVVTGGASGIGAETARALAAAGAEVTIAVRDTDAGCRVADAIAASTDGPPVRVARLELTDRASVAAFAAAWRGPLHVLVNNAGVMASPETRTGEGWELQFATNHLGHFALAHALHAALAGADGARIVSVSSSAHQRSPVIFDDLHFAFRPYDPWLAYGQSKTANVLFAVAATARWAGDGILVNALHPGSIATALQRHVDPAELDRLRAATTVTRKTTEQGAATSVLLAASPLLDGVGGRYFVDCDEAEVVARRQSDMRGVAPYAVDVDNAERLWAESRRMLGI
jgi:NAD(P)-dependent dehydrogenase (short-subunit alcohol dehydrogenase family)